MEDILLPLLLGTGVTLGLMGILYLLYHFLGKRK